MAAGYDAWRISFQSSEQAARAAWHSWQQEAINYALEQDDFREYRKEAEALIEKLVEQLVEINKAARIGSSLLAADLATISRSALSIYAEWKDSNHD